MKPIALTVAGTDSSGGAGVATDLRAMTALGVHGVMAITAVTAQNNEQCTGVYPVSPDFVRQQIDTLFARFSIRALKTGMLVDAAIVEVLAEVVERRNVGNLVIDPVLRSTSQSELLTTDGLMALKKRLLPSALLVTPNIPEAEVLSGEMISNVEDMKKAAEIIAKTGARGVIITGGHLPGRKIVDLLYYDGEHSAFGRDRIEAPHMRGTGCAFSSALAASLAKGQTVPEAFKSTENYMDSYIRSPLW